MADFSFTTESLYNGHDVAVPMCIVTTSKGVTIIDLDCKQDDICKGLYEDCCFKIKFGTLYFSGYERTVYETPVINILERDLIVSENSWFYKRIDNLIEADKKKLVYKHFREIKVPWLGWVLRKERTEIHLLYNETYLFEETVYKEIATSNFKIKLTE